MDTIIFFVHYVLLLLFGIILSFSGCASRQIEEHFRRLCVICPLQSFSACNFWVV